VGDWPGVWDEWRELSASGKTGSVGFADSGEWAIADLLSGILVKMKRWVELWLSFCEGRNHPARLPDGASID
jgi:hypothetical protein